MTGASRTARVKKPQGCSFPKRMPYQSILRVGSLRRAVRDVAPGRPNGRAAVSSRLSSAHSLTNERRKSFEPATGIEPVLVRLEGGCSFHRALAGVCGSAAFALPGGLSVTPSWRLASGDSQFVFCVCVCVLPLRGRRRVNLRRLLRFGKCLSAFSFR